MEGRSLKVWLGHSDEEGPVQLPTAAEVLYSEPNPNSSRKQCKNCFLFMPGMKQCVIHDSDVPIAEDMICGYHVYGQPSVVELSRENMEPVKPEFSGLERVKRGASCDTCDHYSARGQQSGVCRAVRDDAGEKAQVEALGCCTRWTKGG